MSSFLKDRVLGKMLPVTRQGLGAAPGPAGADAEGGNGGDAHGGAELGQLRRQGFGVQEWADGSRYEGDSVNGYKHGSGRYTWKTGEYYEGSFYKDYRHGCGLYCWPTGHRFVGKFYLNRKEGYGEQIFPNGNVFQGLYHNDLRFGPGVVSYPDGCQDVGLWLGERLLAICTTIEGGFSLKNFPEYAAFAIDTLTEQPPTHTTTHSEVHTETLPLDESFILPPGIESYSTDGDHLPLPPGRRRELDEHFYGKLWEPDPNLYQGYEKDPLSTLPLQARMQAHIHTHRLQAENLDWGVTTVVSLSREGFGPKGPLEVTSELLIQHASKGKLQAVSEILKTGLVHPDIGDSQGYTALIAATVLSACNESPLISQAGSITGTHGPSRPQTACTALSDQTIESQLSDQSYVEQKKPSAHLQSHKVCIDDELITEHWADLSEPKTPTETVYLHEEERREESEAEFYERGQSSRKEYEEENKKEEKLLDDHYQTWQKGRNQVEGLERKVDSRNEYVELKEKVEKDADEKEKIIQDRYVEGIGEKENDEEPEVEHSCLVLDGHIALGSVQWKGRGKAVGRIQGKNKELIQNQNFDSACSVSSYKIQVTEELMQRSAEALSRTGIPQCSDTQETVRRMAAMKIEHRVRLNTLKLLLERGADPNVSKVPMPVLFLAVMAADTEVVRQLLLCGARTDIALPSEKRGLYPLHTAASLPGPVGPSITEMLLHAISDPDVQASDQDEIYEPDNIFIKSKEPLGNNERPDHKEGGRTALHIACQRDSDYLNASKVVALLLAHRASTDLLWSGHSPLSLAIASGNDLAVEELLKGGADPNIPLGSGVGSALCALANINYHLGGNRTKLLDMLAKAGADILMPVTVEDVVGTAVDFAHYSFNKDLHIAKTPFHALNMREREIYKSRCQLLSMMGDLLRKTAAEKEREYLEGKEHNKRNGISSEDSLIGCDSQPHHSAKRQPLFMFCYQCGLSVGVKLTACSRCHKVFYCSRACKLKGWDKRHKDECIRVSASLNGIQKGTVFTSQKGSTPMTVTFKTKPVPKPTSVKVKFQKVLRPLHIPEKVSESQLNLKENYSHN